jgi:heme-degrading monooxygenase HmoA
MNYIAMNRFKVPKENESAFEDMWAKRESYLEENPGYVSFYLLKGAQAEGQILYSTHTVWATKADFVAWTKSEGFAKAHARAGQNTVRLFVGHPQFEGFEAVLTQLPAKAVAA